jgi:diguanylate cyclase (GGDEF)-like protein
MIPARLLSRVQSAFSKTVIVSVSLVALGAVWCLDLVTGAELGMSVFYLFPIMLVTWYAGLTWGLVGSALASAGLVAADLIDARPFASTAVLFWNSAVHFGFFLVLAATLHRLRASYDRERLLSRTDPLTGASNKRSFDETVSIEVDRARRYAHPLSLAFLDADNFKAVNDRFGHDSGDELLCMVVRVLRSNLREFDAVARLGGDEFAVLLPETGSEPAGEIFSRVRGDLETAMRQHGWPVTFSIGLVTFNGPETTRENLLRRADSLMYEIKRNGKAAVRHAVWGCESI